MVTPSLEGAGLISAAPGRRNGQLQASAKQVEAMVRTKMEHKEYILLCLEDTNDWSNATTRRLVMQARRCTLSVALLYASGISKSHMSVFCPCLRP